jgi:hypothetical protein
LKNTIQAETWKGLTAPLFFILILLTACTEEITIAKKCSQNGTYCEDLKNTQGSNEVYTNLTGAQDSRDTTNTTTYEEVTP